MASAQIRKIQKYFGATVGPEKPNGAVSPYFSGIILEPLVGTQVYQHVHCERNERIAANWVGGATVDRALTLGGAGCFVQGHHRTVQRRLPATQLSGKCLARPEPLSGSESA